LKVAMVASRVEVFGVLLGCCRMKREGATGGSEGQGLGIVSANAKTGSVGDVD
jgi:hypothetical protein